MGPGQFIDAKEYAFKKHENDGYGPVPYSHHLEHVHKILVWSGMHTYPGIEAACWLHDVLEDTDTTLEELTEKFGHEVANTVRLLTDAPGLNRKERKRLTFKRMQGHKAATIIKVCDRIANIEFSLQDEKKLKMYLDEDRMFRGLLFQDFIPDHLWKRLEEISDYSRRKTLCRPFGTPHPHST